MFNVLLVEDNSGTRILLKKILTRKFYCKVYTANDGLEALKMIQIHKPDFIILDYMMPQMDGYEFLKEIRYKKDYHDIPVIMITAINEKLALKKVLSLGISDYILKPFNIETTMEKIAQIMYNRNNTLHRKLDGLEKRIETLEKRNRELKKNTYAPSLIDKKIFLN